MPADGAQSPPATQERGIERVASACPCHTCVFFSRPAVGTRVLPEVEKLIRSHRKVSDFQFHLWPFDVLENSPFAGSARASAHVAQVVVMATDRDERMPASLREWLEVWQASSAGGKNRLLALFHSESPDRLPLPALFRELVDFASTSGIGIVWNRLPDEVPSPPPASSVAAGTP